MVHDNWHQVIYCYIIGYSLAITYRKRIVWGLLASMMSEGTIYLDVWGIRDPRRHAISEPQPLEVRVPIIR